jgi:hypothetical protein
VSELRELHEAAKPAPWTLMADGTVEHEGLVFEGDFMGGGPTPEWRLNVALRNAYADGTLVEREKVDALVEAARLVLPALDCVEEKSLHVWLNAPDKPAVTVGTRFADFRAALAALEARDEG